MPTHGSGLFGEAWRVGVAVLLGAVACGGEAEEPQAPRGFGQVHVATIVDLGGPGTHITTIGASFFRAETRSECQIATHGACQVVECAGSAGTFPDAGQLTLENADGSFMQVLLPDASGSYAFGDETEAFEPGEAVSVRFAGGDVPAFETSGLLPQPLVLTEPVIPSGSDLFPVERGSDLTIRWSGGLAGTRFSVSQDTLSPTVLRCSTPSEGGSLTVPASALAALDRGRLDLRTVAATTVAAGTYDVSLVLLSAAVNAEGQGVSLALEP
jgi:hypothetical protein